MIETRLKKHVRPALFPLFFFVCTALHVSAQDTTVTTGYGSITFSTITQYNLGVNYSASITPPVTGYLFLRANAPLDETFLEQNLEQTVPQKGSMLDYAKVLQSTAPTLFNVRELLEETHYYFALVPYRTGAGVTSFLTDSSFFAHVKTPSANPGNYYDGITFDSPDILTDLNALLQNHTLVDYGNYKTTMVQNIFEHDTIGGQKTVTCEYSNEKKLYAGNFDFVALDYSREHLLPRSWMPTGGDFATPEGADYHNLALTNLGDANSLRSNFPYGEIVTVMDSFLECYKGRDASNDIVFEPRDEKKGDAARAIFYQLVCYNGKSGNWGIDNLLSYGNEQSIQTLLNWHHNDLPDKFEKTKHEYIFTLQNNRNPFIDYPDLADCIDFAQIVKDASCGSVAVEGVDPVASISIYPNPATDVFYISLENPATVRSFHLYDLAGRVLSEKQISVNQPTINIPVADISSGFYLGVFTFENGTTLCKKVEVARP